MSELQAIEGRERALRNITRYSLYSVMWYRTNLWSHTRRVAWIVQQISPAAKKVFGDAYDAHRAYLLALVHDDAEILTGDIQAGNKSKMSEEQLKQVKQKEREAIDTMASHAPSHIEGYEYRALLLEAFEKNTLEAMVLDWADKYDGFNEAWHEVFAGNTIWTTNVVNEYGTIPLPTEFYFTYFKRYQTKFPRSAELFTEHNPWFTFPSYLDAHEAVKGRTVHTLESLGKKGYGPYDQWIALTLSQGTKEDISNLHTRKE